MRSQLRRLATLARLGPLASLAFITLAPARATACPAPQYAPREYGVGASLPVDTALTYNGRRAAVRSAITTGTTSMPYANGVTFWDLTTATAPAPPRWLATFDAMGEGVVLTPGGYQPSDVIELTNTRCVAIGSGYSQFQSSQHDQSYIDLFDATATPSQLATHTVGQDSASIAQNQWAGYANDLAITRDGAYAIVNTDNWIHRLDIGNGNIASINIGDAPYGPLPSSPGDPRNLCTPNGAVDSVAVTNDRAVLTTSRSYGGIRDTWVYLVDIASWTVAWEQPIVPEDEIDSPPHDVAITPNGLMAVVTSDRMVSLFDLANDQLLGTYYDPDASRLYQVQVDSVEVNDERAVVISDRVQGGTSVWQVDIFDISLSNGLTLVATHKDHGTGPSRAHDLALADLKKAVVRTSYDNVVFQDVWNPIPIVLTSPNGSNAHEYMNYLGGANYTAFSSDSVVVATLSGGAQIAVTIGARQTTPGSGVWMGYVDFIDLVPVTPTLTQRSITSSGVNGVIPLDLTLTRDRFEVAVRSSDTLPNAPASSGADVTFLSMTAPFNLLQGYGGNGYVMGLDSIAAGHNGLSAPNNRKRVISTSEDPGPPPDGKVHLVDRP